MKKLFVLTMVVLMVISSTFAQGSSESSAKEESKTPEKATVIVDGKKELVFWTRINDTFEAEIAAFEAAHPDVTVKRVGIGNDYDDLQTKYIAASVSGELPHVGMVSQRYGIPQLLDAGVVVPVEQFMSQEEQDDVYQAYWDRYTYKGTKVALPFQVSMPVLYVNMTLLNAKGLSIPRTWDELIATAKALTEDTNGDGVTDIYGFSIPADAPWYLNGLFKAAGADIIQGPEEVNYDQPEVIAVYESIQKMVADGSMPANQHSSAKDDFKNGTVAMLLNSCAGNGSIAKGVKGFEYSLVYMPSINGNICAPLGGNGLAVFKYNSEMEALAWEFVNFMTSAESYSGFSLGKGYVPIKKSYLNLPKVAERVADPFWAETFDQLDDLYGQPINPVDATIWACANDILSKIEADPKADVAKLVKAAQKEIEDFLLDY